MLRIGLVLGFIGFLGVSFAQAEIPSSHHRRSVTNLLTSKHGFPTRKQMLRTGKASTTVRILTAIVNDREKHHVLRLNALRAFEYFPIQETEKFLGSVLYGRFQKPAFKSTAMRAMARAFGSRMYFEVLPFLRDAEPRVRVGAALALGDLDDPRVMGNLRNHLIHEQNLSVRVALEKAMKHYRERARKRRLKEEAARRSK